MIVPTEAAGERLDVFLAEHTGSRTAAQRLIDAGAVTVDGERKAKRHVLHGGERVEIGELPARPEPEAAEAPFEIAWSDEHLLVVDKPAGVVVHPARGNRTGTLAQALRGVAKGGEDQDRAGIVHRLDRDTSGLLLVARTEAAYDALRAQMRARAITREYLALVEGRPPAREGTIDAPLGRDRRVRTRISSDTDEGKPAVTHFEIERALPHSTLLRVRLETGRTHQIRAHLLEIGHPVLGDPEYGKPGYGLERQFLHAERLALAHPITSAPLDVRSALPEDLRAALERAGK
jgi:23S rRNA pseudouridine1911/1915/1917 synthase